MGPRDGSFLGTRSAQLATIVKLRVLGFPYVANVSVS